MQSTKTTLAMAGFAVLVLCGVPLSRAQDVPADPPPLPVSDPICTYFGPGLSETAVIGLAPASASGRATGRIHPLSEVTEQVASQVGYVPGGSPSGDFRQTHQTGSIDSYLFADMQAAGVQPAPLTTDWEFIRRVTLDLTGRIPAPDRVLSFVNDSSSSKRAVLIDQLLATPEWADKWTMYLGDLFKNTQFQPSSSLNRFPEGRNAFYQWIHDSITSGKAYNQMATELIIAAGTNSYQ